MAESSKGITQQKSSSHERPRAKFQSVNNIITLMRRLVKIYKNYFDNISFVTKITLFVLLGNKRFW